MNKNPLQDLANRIGMYAYLTAIGGLRYWPASGLDLAMSAGYRWVDGAGHVDGADLRGPRGELRVRIER